MLSLEEQVEEARKLMNDIEFDMISKGRCYDEINKNMKYKMACEEWKRLSYQLNGEPKFLVPDIRYRRWMDNKLKNKGQNKRTSLNRVWLYTVYDLKGNKLLVDAGEKECSEYLNYTVRSLKAIARATYEDAYRASSKYKVVKRLKE